MKVYAPSNKPEDQVGGGWTFLRNFKKYMQVHFVNSWQECDVFFIAGITMVDEGEVKAASEAGKKIVLRVDNVPKKSRNKRSTPHERLKAMAEFADVVIYQSKWAKQYVSPLCGDGTIIYNGVDQSIFKPLVEGEPARDDNKYLFVYHGKNDMKGFWTAHLIFQNIFRENPKAEFLFINDFGSETNLLVASKYDFWNGEKFQHLPPVSDPRDMAELMRRCGTLIYPAVSDACPNTVIEALSCGMKVIGASSPDLSSTQELLDLDFNKAMEGGRVELSAQRMCEEYLGIFNLLASGESGI